MNNFERMAFNMFLIQAIAERDVCELGINAI